MESSCCLFHLQRLLHCLSKLNRQRQSPRRYEYSLYVKDLIDLYIAQKSTIQDLSLLLSDIITPGASTVAMFKTLIMEFARFLLVSNTASSKRLQYAWTCSQPIHPLLYNTSNNDYVILSSE